MPAFDDQSMSVLLETFVAESEEGLARAEQSLLVLERSPADAEAVASVFRVVHTIKGNAGIFDFAAVSAVSHAMEDLLDRLRRRSAPVSESLVTLLLRSVDVLGVLLRESIRGARPITALEEGLIDQLAHAGEEKTPDEGAASTGDAHSSREALAVREVHKSLRVDVAKLDRLLDLSGEIGIARGRLSQLLDDPRVPRAALEAHRDSLLLHMEMQELVMKLRMIPVGPTFRQMLRTVRDTAHAVGKEAELRISGDDVEVDMAVVEQLRDPLMHMVRNSVGHGIETPEARRAAGKAATGALTLHSFHEAGSIVIELADDGAGLDRERILDRARAQGLIDGGDTLSDEEVGELIFHPGFSTAEQITDVSGRGVGLDVVRRNIEAIHGTVAVSSTRGAGTTVRIRLPLTLAIIDGLRVGVAGESYIIPMEAVVEALDLPRDPMYESETTGLVLWRGEDIPFIRLRDRLVFGHGRPASTREHVVVVRYGEQRRAAFVVDELFGECQSVVKPLATILQGITGISGSAILPSGRIAFIVDVPSLLQTESNRSRRRRADGLAAQTSTRPEPRLTAANS